MLNKLLPKYTTSRIEFQRKFWPILQKGNGRIFPVDVDNCKIGFFAHLNVCVRILRFADENGFIPLIRFLSGNYIDPRYGSNWFEYHFKLKSLPASSSYRPLFRFLIRTHRDLDLSRPDDLLLVDTKDLLFKYIEPHEDIKSIVDEFCASNKIGNNTIAIHYRGTDKSREAPRLEYEDAFLLIEKYLAENPFFLNVFVASDETKFVDALINRIKHIRISYLEDSIRSSDHSPIHLSGSKIGNFELGRDAIINTLVMSRCSTLIRTSSLLSSWASVFNPELKVVLMSKAYSHSSWFPERVIEKNALYIG